MCIRDSLPGWDKIPLKKILEAEFSLPIQVDHDAGACALAEYYWGAAKKLHSVVYLTCGTGFGMGIVIDGNIYYGAHGHNCEIGHARYADDGPIAFGKAGSYESYCAGSSLGSLANHLGKIWIEKVNSVFSEEALPDAQQICKITPSALGKKLQDYSAIAVAHKMSGIFEKKAP